MISDTPANSYYLPRGDGMGRCQAGSSHRLSHRLPLVLLALVMAAIMGGLVAVALLIAKKRGRKEAIPFGPFLSLATLITLCYGEAAYLTGIWN